MTDLDEELIPYLVELDGREGIPPPKTKDQLLVYLTRVTVAMKRSVTTLADEVATLHQIVERLDKVSTSGMHDLREIKKKAKKYDEERSDWWKWAVRFVLGLIAMAIGALVMWLIQGRH